MRVVLVALLVFAVGCIPEGVSDAGSGGAGGTAGGGGGTAGGGGGGGGASGGGTGGGATGGGTGGGDAGRDYEVLARSITGICFGAPPPVAVTPIPLVPSVSVAVACAASATGEISDGGSETAGSLMLGRWERCSPTPSLLPVNFEGLEFYANGLFSTLQRAPDGGHEPTPDAGRGHYNMYTPYQLGLSWEGIGTVHFHPKFSPSRDTMAAWYQAPGDLKMARLPPDPNAATALPPVKLTEGSCPLFGVWDTTATGDNTRSTVVFGNDGHFIGSPVTGNACTAPTFWGRFWIEQQGAVTFTDAGAQLDAGVGDTLTMVHGVGFAPCGVDYETIWQLSFSSDCQTLTADSHLDNCTGARPFLTSHMTLRRR